MVKYFLNLKLRLIIYHFRYRGMQEDAQALCQQHLALQTISLEAGSVSATVVNSTI